VGRTEAETSPIYWGHMSMFYLKPESSLRNVVFQTKDRTLDNSQNCDSVHRPTLEASGLAGGYRCFGGIFYVHLQTDGRIVSAVRAGKAPTSDLSSWENRTNIVSDGGEGHQPLQFDVLNVWSYTSISQHTSNRWEGLQRAPDSIVRHICVYVVGLSSAVGPKAGFPGARGGEGLEVDLPERAVRSCTI
jgi:hypothetical protein